MPTLKLKAMMTTPGDALKFVKDVGVQFLAPSFGNVHGPYGSAGPQWDKQRRVFHPTAGSRELMLFQAGGNKSQSRQRELPGVTWHYHQRRMVQGRSADGLLQDQHQWESQKSRLHRISKTLLRSSGADTLSRGQCGCLHRRHHILYEPVRQCWKGLTGIRRH